jgi:broad specificity phosphatase PhoE
MTDFYIFRHGDTIESGNLLIKILGRKRDSHELPILPKGLPALKKIGVYLKNISTDANFCSPYLRCMESAKIVSDITKNKYIPDERICEFDNNGEKFTSFNKRVGDFLNEIDNNNYSAVSICTHGAVIAAIKHLKTNGRFFIFQGLDYPTPGNLVVIKNGKIEVLDFNK